MAYTAQNTAAASGFSAAVHRVFSAIADGIVHIAEANSRVKSAQRLHAMSDEELARRGLKREDIARHVFSDSFYL